MDTCLIHPDEPAVGVIFIAPGERMPACPTCLLETIAENSYPVSLFDDGPVDDRLEVAR